jgi:hypothetical protein
MAGQKTITSTHKEVVPPPTPPSSSYDVSGTLFPDRIGNYPFAGTFNGQSYYENVTHHYALWYKLDPTSWIISSSPGSEVGARWVKGNAIITGNYFAINPATGTATVTPGA